jgi:hypothetical protein
MRKRLNSGAKGFSGSQMIAVITLLILAFPMAGFGQQNIARDAILEDFSDIVTPTDFGFNDFSGNFGTLNKDAKPFGQQTLACTNNILCALRFQWDFTIDTDREAFTGIFFSLFGLTDTKVTFDGQNIQTISFPEHALNLDRIDGSFLEPGAPRRFDEMKIEITNTEKGRPTLRLELKDVNGGGRFTRFRLAKKGKKKVLTWRFRDQQSYELIGGRDLDLGQAKTLNLVIERENIADDVKNPTKGTLDIHRIWFTPNRPETEPTSDEELLNLLERRTAQYFIDWTSRKSGSFGFPQDRSTFQDLLTVGGVGFALPAYIIAAERGWIPRSEALARTRSVLLSMADQSAFGPERVGRIGYKGWFYHFLGPDGRRKLNFDFPQTSVDEALQTVELSTIDTGLALMGVLAAQTYFGTNNADEAEIRSLAQAIYDSVEWPFMLEPSSRQFYLGWKPNEQRTPGDKSFSIPDAQHNGMYSSKGDGTIPATLDFYTDEAAIVSLLALGSKSHPVPVDVHCAWKRDCIKNGIINSFPGSLFTYQFMHAFLDTKSVKFPACAGEAQADWYENSRRATFAAIDYATRNPRGFKTYGSDSWGITAAEGPDDLYRANGAQPVACNPSPEEDGTIAYYGMLSAVSFGADLRARAISALRKAWQRGHWHFRFGLPDAFHDEVSQLSDLGSANSMIRKKGPWANRALFAIDQGPMLLHLANARSGLIWRLIAENPNIQRSLNRLNATDEVLLQAEGGTGNGQVMLRSAALNQRTVALQASESLTFSFQFSGEARYRVDVRYSNDNFGPMEVVGIAIDGIQIGNFVALDTGDFGNGWNNFLWSGPTGSVNLSPGLHNIAITVSGGDGFGVEIDAIKLERER